MVDRGGHRIYLILRKIATFHGEWFGISELADKTNLPRSTIHNQLSELVKQGVIEYERIYPGKYRSRYASLHLRVTMKDITARLQAQGIEPTADVLAAALAQMRAAASLAADDALNDFILDCMEDIA